MWFERALWLAAIAVFAVLWIHERGRHYQTKLAAAGVVERAATALARRGVSKRKIAQSLVPERLRKSLKRRDKLKK